MDKIKNQLTILFDNPFWVGIFENVSNGNLKVSKIIFGSEPKDYEVYDFILKNYYSLRFSPAVVNVVEKNIKNPKRLQREIKKQTKCNGIGTKSQQALKIQREQIKIKHKQDSSEKHYAEKQRKFELKQQKRKKKHKGR